MKATLVAPGDWVRCTMRANLAEVHTGGVYKIASIHRMNRDCDAPVEHGCQRVAFMLEGIENPYCSQCFTPIRPGGPSFLSSLMIRSMSRDKNGPA